MAQTKQQKRNQLVLQRLIEFSNEGNEFAKEIAFGLEVMLDDLASDDFFGTERQCDPRGDCRDENWTMKKVEGIDK
jgi:hypothetical protein